MGSLKDGQIASVKALIDLAPDSAVHGLEAALKADRSGGAVSLIRDLVNAEAVERRACAAVLSPVLQLCGGSPHDLTRVTFPPGTPRKLWRALKQTAPAEVEHAVAAWLGRAWSDASPPVFNKLCALAAKGLRSDEPTFKPVAASLAAGGPEALARFALLLEVSPLVRAALMQLPEWLVRTNGANAAAMRLIYKDATQVSDKAGPLLLEVLLAHLTEPWLVMRLVAAIMDTPNERYVAASELASFPLRLLDSIDACIGKVQGLDPAGGAAAGQAAARAVAQALATLVELEAGLSLQKDGPWSNRLAHQRRSLGAAVESRLHEVEARLNLALPTHSRSAARSMAGMPKLTAPVDPAAVQAAGAVLAFVIESRSVGESGGFGTLRTRAQDVAEARLDQYGDDLLELLHGAASAEEKRFIPSYVDAVADLLAVTRDPKAAGVLRRRAAA
jgi:hypothetical protein